MVPPGRVEPSRLRVGSGEGQAGAPGRLLPLPVVALVSDNDGRPVADVEVRFEIHQGGGSVSEPSVLSDHQGRAQVGWTLGAEPGPHALRVMATDASGFPLNGSPLTVSAQGVRPFPAKLVLRQAPSALAQNGTAFARQPVVAVVDSDDEPVPGTEVSATVAAGPGELTGTTTVSTDASGRATFTNLAIVGLAGPRTLAFGVAEPLDPLTATVEVQAGAFSGLDGVAPLAYEAIVNSPVSPAPAVRVTDASGNPVAGVLVTFAADRDGSVSPRTVTTDGNGIARVSSWTLGRTAGIRYTLSARLATGNPIIFTGDARAGSAGGLEIVTQPPTSARSGAPFDRQPVVQVVDQLGNPAPQAGVGVVAALFAGPAGSLVSATASTDAAGRATFSGLALNGLVGEYTLSFSAPSLAGVTSAPISLAAGPASRLAVARQPAPTTRSRLPMPTQPAVQLQDQWGNPVPQGGVQVTASIESGGGTLAGPSVASTDGSGFAAFSGLAIVGPPGARTLRFASATPSAAVVSEEVTLPAVATIAVVTAPPATAVVGSVLPTPGAWSLADAGGQPVADAVATFATTPGNSIEPSGTTSDENGVVRLASWSVSQTAGEQRVTLQVADAGSSGVTLRATPGPARRLVAVEGDGQSAPVNDQLPEPLVVRVVDQFGNGVSGTVVAWRTCDGIGDYDATTDHEGYASAVQSTGPVAATFCVRASSDGLEGSPVEFTFTATSASGPPAEARTAPPPSRP